MLIAVERRCKPWATVTRYQTNLIFSVILYYYKNLESVGLVDETHRAIRWRPFRIRWMHFFTPLALTGSGTISGGPILPGKLFLAIGASRREKKVASRGKTY